ncbi:MAG: class I SAM-dependent methyltransferase [Agarilytica sp.]
MNNDLFQHKANTYETIYHRVANVDNIAKAMLQNIDLNPSMKIMDFGSGTGLLLERIAPHVHTITAVDISTSMNRELEKKRSKLASELEIIEKNLSSSNLDRTFDGIISSMTMHHIRDIESMLKKFYAMLNENGFVAIADLDIENGSFHTEDTGVFHQGFDRQALLELIENTGFKDEKIRSASTVNKPQGDFSVFLLTAYK